MTFQLFHAPFHPHWSQWLFWSPSPHHRHKYTYWKNKGEFLSLLQWVVQNDFVLKMSTKWVNKNRWQINLSTFLFTDLLRTSNRLGLCLGWRELQATGLAVEEKASRYYKSWPYKSILSTNTVDLCMQNPMAWPITQDLKWHLFICFSVFQQ